jgi:hypothetical protein
MRGFLRVKREQRVHKEALGKLINHDPSNVDRAFIVEILEVTFPMLSTEMFDVLWADFESSKELDTVLWKRGFHYLGPEKGFRTSSKGGAVHVVPNRSNSPGVEKMASPTALDRKVTKLDVHEE